VGSFSRCSSVGLDEAEVVGQGWSADVLPPGGPASIFHDLDQMERLTWANVLTGVHQKSVTPEAP
jgi:hypothetical protein